MGHMFNAMLLHKLPSLFPWKHNKTKMMAEPVLEEGVRVEEDLQPCIICGRTFLPAPLTKHTKICERNASKKRKVFNSLRQRVEGTDLALFHQKTYLKKNNPDQSGGNTTSQPAPVPCSVGPSGNSNKIGHIEGGGRPLWKEKHNQLVESIRAARSADTVKLLTSSSSIVSKPRSSSTMVNSAFERCPCCDRQFGPKAYDRHVEWCKEKMSRLPASNLNTNQEAKERLEARTKYRVPPMNKNKKTVKEKYQMSPTATTSSVTQMPGIPNVRSTGNPDRKPTLQRSSSVRRTTSLSATTPDRSADSTRMEKSPDSGSKNRNPNPPTSRRSEPLRANINNKNNINKQQKNTSNVYNPFVTAERQLLELLECDDFKTYNNQPKNNNTTNNKTQSTSPTPKLKSISPTLSKPIKSAKPQKKRESVIDPPYHFKDIIIGHDPRDDIDFELLENFINDNFADDDLMRKLDLDTISLASCSTKTDQNASFYDDISIDPRLINDFDNLSIPDNSDTETTTTPDMIRQNPLAHSNRFRLEPLDHNNLNPNRKSSTSSISSFADLNATTPSYRSEASIAEAKKKNLAMKKLIPDPVKPTKNLKNREDVQNYFNESGKESSGKEKSEQKDQKVENTQFDMVAAGDDLFTVDDDMYEEYKKYEQMYLMEKEEQMKREAEMRNNEESVGHMISGDSAYGSLNRSGKTKVRSKVTKLSPMEPARLDSASSSGSDTCIMQNAVTHPMPIKAIGVNNNNKTNISTMNSKLSKFCHECGNRYPLTTAKFCVECGVRRLPEIDINSDDEDENEDL